MPKKRNVKKIILIVLILFIVVLVVRGLILDAIERSRIEEKEYTSVSDFENIKEIAEYMGCTYIKEQKSTGDNYDLDIYLKFKYPLYTDEISNEDYYYQMLALMLGYLNYQNIRLIDEENDILIAVKCNKEAQELESILINGQSNYFARQSSLKSIKEYQQFKTTKMEINSEIINNLVNNNWSKAELQLGEEDSIYDGYKIYFEEGLEVKASTNKILNIRFTKRYLEDVINGIKVGESFEKIIEKLGEPTFKGQKPDFIGYKGSKVYVFFSDSQISVYPVEKDYETAQFVMLVEEFRDSADIAKFVSGITDIWPDYDYYEYGDNFVNISYASKGFKVQLNNEFSNTNGLILYNNYEGTIVERIRTQNETMDNVYYNNKDLVYEAEFNICREHNYEYLYLDYLEIKADTFDKEVLMQERPRFEKDSSKYFALMALDDMKIISINEEYPNAEILEKVYTYFWVNDDVIIFSLQNRGIYEYNLETRQLTSILEGEEDYYIRDYQDGKIYYDNKVIIYISGTKIPTNYNSIIWLDNTNLAYSINGKGIYKYNTQTEETQVILEGNEDYVLEKYENSRLFYNGTSIIYLLYDQSTLPVVTE